MFFQALPFEFISFSLACLCLGDTGIRTPALAKLNFPFAQKTTSPFCTEHHVDDIWNDKTESRNFSISICVRGCCAMSCCTILNMCSLCLFVFVFFLCLSCRAVLCRIWCTPIKTLKVKSQHACIYNH